MKKPLNLFISLLFLFTLHTPTFAVEVAPRISDMEIIEGLAGVRGDIKKLETDIKRLEEGQKALDKRIDDLRSEMKSRFEAVDKRFDILQWMFGLFITISLVILGSVLRMQWQMHRRQTQVETSLETQKDELAFIKGLIEKLLPPRGVV